MRIAGIQPGWLPWLGYFDQMLQVDLFLVADEMPFSRSGWVHRNRVLGPNGVVWLRLPVRPLRAQRIDAVAIAREVPWVRTHVRTLEQSYAKSGAAVDELGLLTPLFDQQATRAVDVVVPVLRHLAARLEIRTPIVVSSQIGLDARAGEFLGPEPTPTERIGAYLRVLGASTLLEGASGRGFLDLDVLRRSGIGVAFHDYRHPFYEQRSGEFVSHLSVLDLLLSHGAAQAAELLRRSTRATV